MKKIIYALIGITVLGLIYYFSSRSQIKTVSSNADLLIFWGEGCPHCEVVKDYIRQNNVDAKIGLQLKEVYFNKQNQKDLQTIVSEKCPDIAQGQGVGVPLAFSYSENKCLSGDRDIIDYLTQKTVNK